MIKRPYLSRVAKRRKVAEILVKVAAKYNLGVDDMRSKTLPRKIREILPLHQARVEFIRRASKFAGTVVISDMLFCDPTTVRYHANKGYRERKRASNDRWLARSRGAAGEDRGVDRTVPAG